MDGQDPDCWFFYYMYQHVHVSLHASRSNCSFSHVEGFIMIKYFISFQFSQILLLEVMFEQIWFRIFKREKIFHNVQHHRGIELGSRRWESSTLPQRYIPYSSGCPWVVLSC